MAALSAACVLLLMFEAALGLGAGEWHTCALRLAGAVACWGDGTYGQLGNGGTADQLSPVAVAGLGDAVALSADGSHTCALRRAGTVSCWGRGEYGQLGNGGTADQLSPVAVAGLVDAVALSAAELHTCALRSSGAVACWGRNRYGQLGNGGTADQLSPVAVAGLVDAMALSAGALHTCAVRRAGTVSCWGYGRYGVLGNGGTADQLSPVAARGLVDAVALSAGTSHTCAVRSSGAVACWGWNSNGQLGNGGRSNELIPVDVEGLSDAIADGEAPPCNGSDVSAVRDVYLCRCGTATCTAAHTCYESQSFCQAPCGVSDGSAVSDVYPCTCGTASCTAGYTCFESQSFCEMVTATTTTATTATPSLTSASTSLASASTICEVNVTENTQCPNLVSMNRGFCASFALAGARHGRDDLLEQLCLDETPCGAFASITDDIESLFEINIADMIVELAALFCLSVYLALKLHSLRSSDGEEGPQQRRALKFCMGALLVLSAADFALQAASLAISNSLRGTASELDEAQCLSMMEEGFRLLVELNSNIDGLLIIGVIEMLAGIFGATVEAMELWGEGASKLAVILIVDAINIIARAGRTGL